MPLTYIHVGKTSRIRSFNSDVANRSSPGDSFYTYDGSRNLVKRHVTEQGSTKIFYQHGGVELIIEGSERRFRRTFANAIVERSGNTLHTSYVYTDHLGSVDVITNAAGQLLEKLSFDAFGKRRQVYTAAHVPVALSLASILNKTSRGFTGHLQVDHASIVHMGGRIYDSHIGRFLQADPFVQSPSNSQNFNRYSYVLNNPLSYTDPSGYLFKKLKKFAGVIAGVALVYFTGGMASPFVGTWYGAAAAGAIAGAVGAAANGGNVLKGALWGAFSAAAFYGVGSAFGGDVAFGSSAHMMKTAAHGLTGGVMNVLQGGKFGHGFAAAGTAQLAAPGIDALDKGQRFSPGRIAAAAVVGGTASSLSGGKFSNGAVTGAFSRMFNDEMHHNAGKSLAEYMQEKYGNLAITKEEWGYVEAGDRKSFWDSRLEKGDPLAPVAISILNDDWVHVGGYRLTYGWLANGLTGLSGEALNALGVDLMRAHADAVTHDYKQKIGIPGLLSPRQAAEYHHEVFRAHNISPMRFGGTPLYISPNITRNFWCHGCDHTGSAIR